MAGLGTNTEPLTRIIAERSEVDLVEIIKAYEVKYKTTLASDVEVRYKIELRLSLLIRYY